MNLPRDPVAKNKVNSNSDSNDELAKDEKKALELQKVEDIQGQQTMIPETLSICKYKQKQVGKSMDELFIVSTEVANINNTSP